MESRYIDRIALGIGPCNPDVFEDKSYARGWNAAIKVIDEAPLADVERVRRCLAKEIPGESQQSKSLYKCVSCGFDEITERANYCPGCGAKITQKIRKSAKVPECMGVAGILGYKGYITHIKFSAEDKVLYGKIEGIDDLVTFESSSAENITSEFHKAVDDYIAMCEDIAHQALKRDDKATVSLKEIFCPVCSEKALRMMRFDGVMPDFPEYFVGCDNCDWVSPTGSTDIGDAEVMFREWYGTDLQKCSCPRCQKKATLYVSEQDSMETDTIYYRCVCHNCGWEHSYVSTDPEEAAQEYISSLW